MSASMECHCIRTSALPHTSKLFAAFLEDFSRVASFYDHPPTLEGMQAAVREGNYPTELRRAVAEVLREQNRRFGSDAATLACLDRLAAGAVAVVTGQQVGLFGGPAFSFYKALTAIALAQKLCARGVDAVPVFWLATEDHDLAEVNHSDWLDTQGELRRIEVPAPDAAGRRVGEILLGAPVTAAVESATALLRGPAVEEIGGALREAYRPGESFGSSFGKLFARLLRGRGMILLDPLDARLHRLALPVYRRALEECGALGRDLVLRGKALEKAGFHAQVKVTEPGTLLFFNVAGQRFPLRPRNGGFSAGRFNFSAQEIRDALEATPEAVSANVLLRPVVQDTLLPTAAYVGGPAEIAYFAQCQVVYRRLIGRMPAVLPRAGFTLVEPHVANLLKKYRLEVADVWRGRQHLRAVMDRQALPRDLARQFSSGEKTLRGLLARLRKPVGKLDRTLLGALDTAERKILHQFLKLRGKAGRAEGFRSGLIERHERILLNSLYPHHAPQERGLGLPPFLSAHGLDLLDALAARAMDSREHHVMFL
jgi:bacillithiol biosynthesis cysteine-adding enzyme BshC